MNINPVLCSYKKETLNGEKYATRHFSFFFFIYIIKYAKRNETP